MFLYVLNSNALPRRVECMVMRKGFQNLSGANLTTGELC